MYTLSCSSQVQMIGQSLDLEQVFSEDPGSGETRRLD